MEPFPANWADLYKVKKRIDCTIKMFIEERGHETIKRKKMSAEAG
jgi:hypothetical protein